MKTMIANAAEVPAITGLPGVANPIRPELFAGRSIAHLARSVGIGQFGVNHVRLEPGAGSALRHWHQEEDEFVYVLAGELTLVDQNGEHRLVAGDFAGFPAGGANAHHLINRSSAPAAFLAVGTRWRGRETVHYPDDPFGPQTIERDAHGNRIG